MKNWALLCAPLLACVLLASAGRSSSDSSDSSSDSTSEDSSESHFSRRSRSYFRSAHCDLRSAPSSAVNGHLYIYQKRAGEPVWIKGGLRGLSPSGADFALSFHKGYPSPGECDRAGDTLEGVGGDFAHVTANGNNSGAGINRSITSISLEEGHANSVTGRSIVVRSASDGRRVACCTVDRTRERAHY